MEITRKQVIEELKAILEMQYWNVPLSKAALEYAISSLKTDEAYQIMYEGGEIFTKDDMVAMLEEIQSGIREIEEDMCIRDSKAEMGFYRWIKDSDVENIIQEKINKLKGEL